ncbi:hypothetical protein ACP275_03G080700 [Erythranthe tilingii]
MEIEMDRSNITRRRQGSFRDYIILNSYKRNYEVFRCEEVVMKIVCYLLCACSMGYPLYILSEMDKNSIALICGVFVFFYVFLLLHLAFVHKIEPPLKPPRYVRYLLDVMFFLLL